MSEDLIRKLTAEKAILKQYLLTKFENEDWHGVQDAGSDLRDIQAKLEILLTKVF